MPGVLQDFHSPARGELLPVGFLDLSYPPCFVGNQMRGLGNSLEENLIARHLQQRGAEERDCEHGNRQSPMASVNTIKKSSSKGVAVP